MTIKTDVLADSKSGVNTNPAVIFYSPFQSNPAGHVGEKTLVSFACCGHLRSMCQSHSYSQMTDTVRPKYILHGTPPNSACGGPRYHSCTKNALLFSRIGT